MQIVILGMHRSGTSLATRLIHMMGAYLGPDNLFGANQDNPTGYWERRDVVECNAALLRHHRTNCSQLIVTPWIGTFTPPPEPVVKQRMGSIIRSLNEHDVWVMKDPHLCLTLPHWQPLLDNPTAVITYRNPLEIAQSLAIREFNKVPSLERGLALWEAYAVSLLHASEGMKRVFISHQDLITDPVQAATHLSKELGLQPVPQSNILRFFKPALYRAKTNGMQLTLNPFQELLCSMLRGEIPFDSSIELSSQARRTLEDSVK